MLDGLKDGTSEEHSVSTAAEAIAGLLSDRDVEKLENEDSKDQRDASEEQDEVDETPDDSETDDDDASEQVDDVEESDELEDDAIEQALQPRKIKVNDEIGEVTEEELVKGFLRQEDYTRKTQEVASTRKKFEQEELPQVRAERAELATKLSQLTEALEAATPQEPDWDTLADEDPAQFAQLRRAWDKHQQRLARAREMSEAAQKKVREDQEVQFKAFVTEQREKLLEVIPEWKDSGVAKKERNELIEYAMSRGFSEDELKQVYDHRVIRLLRDAAQFHKAQKAKPKVQEKIDRATVVKPGTPKPRQEVAVAEAKQRAQRLAKSGSVDDAALLIQTMLTPKRSKKRRG